MGAQANTAAGGPLRGWFGLRGGRAATAVNEAPPAPAETRPVVTSLAGEARRQLLDAIGAFLLDNELAVSPSNLLAAHGAFGGSNPRLARRIAAQAHAGEKITQAWLDEAIADDPIEPSADALDRLMGKLEKNLEAFSNSSRAARHATSEYNSQLEQHVVELAQVEDAGSIITSLADIARAMAERTRKVEQDMRRSEEEARTLRRNLENARRDAEIDHLTGLPNRRAFEATLEQHYREAQLAVEALSVAFCDIDHFKAVNDTHGHEAGDRVLRTIAETLAQLTNDNCHVARHGGEEFVMLFRGLPPTEAKARLDAAREEMAGRTLINRKTDEAFGQITFSAGVASVFAYADPRAALAAADEALYKAKQGGRNQVRLA